MRDNMCYHLDRDNGKDRDGIAGEEAFWMI
jgi:hypothetical protein